RSPPRWIRPAPARLSAPAPFPAPGGSAPGRAERCGYGGEGTVPRQDGWDGAPFQMVTMDQLVPKDYFLRRIDEAVDFSFIREMVRPLYSNTGRPSLDPEVALRMFVLGALLGIPESRLCSEISPHAGYRWFCGLTFNDPLPHRSTLTKLRRERWGPSGAFDKAMERVFKQCAESGVLERVKGELEEERAKVAR